MAKSNLPKKLDQPDYKTLAPPRRINGLIAEMKKASQDTKELEDAHRQATEASKKLAAAYKVTHSAGTQQLAVLSDVCRTPSAAGPKPIPYPMIKKTQKATDDKRKLLMKAEEEHRKAVEKTVKILDKKMNECKRKVKTSRGDEAGTMKGMVGVLNTSKTEYMTWSSKVKAQGKSVTKALDLMTQSGTQEVAAIEKSQKGPVKRR